MGQPCFEVVPRPATEDNPGWQVLMVIISAHKEINMPGKIKREITLALPLRSVRFDKKGASTNHQ